MEFVILNVTHGSLSRFHLYFAGDSLVEMIPWLGTRVLITLGKNLSENGETLELFGRGDA